jgi:WhiB family redox-sensing transcriptional regulator
VNRAGLSTGQVERAGLAAERRRSRAVHRGADPVRVHTVFDDADVVTIKLADLLEHRVDHGSWWAGRACVGMPLDLFFPERGDNEAVAAAKAVCTACPVAEPCLEAHLEERDGIYGGTSGRERRRLRSARRREARSAA